ncbi:MAG: hypothetical protein ABJE95_10250 [Byssovorax sp.]
MILRTLRYTPIATLEEAAFTLAVVATCFADRIGGVWTQVHGQHVSITTATAGFVLEVSRIHPDRRRAGGPTHHVPLVARPGQSPIGACTIRVVPNEPGGAAFVLRASLEAPLFNLDPETLLALTGAVADAMTADETCLRPEAWATGPGSWAVLVRAAAGLRGGVTRRCSRGILVILHDGAPTDQTSEAKGRSEAELSRVLGNTEVRAGDEAIPLAVASAAMPWAPPPGPLAHAPPVIAVQHSTLLAPSRPALAGTALSLDIPRGLALPFAKSTGDQPAPPPPTLPGVSRAPAAEPRLSTGTAFGAEAPRAPATPFQAIEPDGHGFDLNRYVDLVAAREEPGAAMADVFEQFGIDAARDAQIEAYWALQFSKQGLLALGLPRLVTKAKLALAARRTGTAASFEQSRETEPRAGTPAVELHAGAPVVRAPAAMTGTAAVSDHAYRPSIPFAATRAVDAPAFAHAAPLPGVQVTPLPGARMPPGANPLVVPDLSLADYAALRAHLMVRGEEDPATWKQFGVTSPAVKQALQDHFAARFRQEPAKQAQFVDRLRTLVAELRARATGR